MIQMMLRQGAWLCIACALVLGTGCQTVPDSIVVPSVPGTAVLAENASARVVAVGDGESWRSLAQRFLGDPELAWLLKEENENVTLAPDAIVVIPRAATNPIGVHPANYQIVPALSYHHFANRGGRLSVSAKQLRAQLRFLQVNGYTAVTLADYEAFLLAKRRLPRKSVLITIDDGYRSAYDVAFPLLKEFSMPATVFIYSDFIGRGGLTHSQIKEMEASGLVEVHAHSKSHANLTESSPSESPEDYLARIEKEVAEPKRRLEAVRGKPTTTMAYPYGATNAPVVDVLRKHGVKLAFTVRRGGNPFFGHPLVLRRSMVYRTTSLEDFAALLRVSESF